MTQSYEYFVAPTEPATRPAAGPAVPRLCPPTVVSAAALAFVQTGVVALGALGGLYLTVRVDVSVGGRGGLGWLLDVVLLGVAALAGVSVVAVLRARRWGAVVLVALEALALGRGLWGLARDGAAGDWLGLALAAGIVVLLALPESRAWVAASR